MFKFLQTFAKSDRFEMAYENATHSKSQRTAHTNTIDMLKKFSLNKNICFVAMYNIF